MSADDLERSRGFYAALGLYNRTVGSEIGIPRELGSQWLKI
jgi:hypothetical protein